jgi:hypothetical protein
MVASILRVSFTVLLCVAPPLVAAMIQPTLSSKVHAVIITVTAVILLLSDRFFTGIAARYNDLHKSKALTLRESQRLQVQLLAIRRQLGIVFALSTVCRLLQVAIGSTLGFTDPSNVAYFYLVLAGYFTLGISLNLFIFLWVSLDRAERFKVRFDAEESRELKRQEILQDIEARPLVRS